MQKAQRQAVIRELIRTQRVPNQESLRELLARQGYDVTQATLSRDVREMRLLKMADAEGKTHYTLPPDLWDHTPPISRLMPTLYVGAEGVNNLLIVKTLAGGAQPVAAALDCEEWPEVAGTVAGDDSVLLVLRSEDSLEVVRARLEKLAYSG